MGGKLNESAHSLIWCRVAGESGEKLPRRSNERRQEADFSSFIEFIISESILCLDCKSMFGCCYCALQITN